MRQHYDLMNAQNWNTDLKKPPRPDIDDLELHKGNKIYVRAVPRIDSFSRARVPLTLDPLSIQHIPWNESPVKEPVRKSTRTGMKGEDRSDTITDGPNTEEIRTPHRKASPVNHRSLNTRKKIYNKFLFIASGLLISLVSGVLIYTWLVRSENGTFSAALDSSFVTGDAVSDSVPSDMGAIDESALLSDDGMGTEYSDDAFGAGADETEGYGELLEDAGDTYGIGSGDAVLPVMASVPSEADSGEPETLSLHEDSMKAGAEEDLSEQVGFSAVSGEKAASKSQNTPDTVLIKEEPSFVKKQPAEIPKTEKDLIPERKFIARDNSAETADRQSGAVVIQPPVEEAAALTSGNAEKEKLTALSHSPSIKSEGSGNTSSALAPVARSGQNISAQEDSSEQKTMQKSPALSAVQEQASKRNITAEMAGPGRPVFSNTFFEENKTETSAGPAGTTSDTTGKAQPAADTGDDTLLKTGPPGIYEQTSQNHKPVKAALLLSSRKEGSAKAGNAALAQNKSAAAEADAHNAQSVTVALKQMSVTYEDLFDTHTNHWPEYNSSTASVLIEDGEYHIEHKAKTGSHIVLHPYGVSSDMDYMIYIDINSVRGSGRNSYGFVFGGIDMDNNYSFQLSSDNHYSIQKMQGGKSMKLAGGQIDNVFIGENSEKTMKIVKQRNKVRFYVDDYYVDELVDVELPGDKVGFYVEGKVKISVDSTRTEIRFTGK